MKQEETMKIRSRGEKLCNRPVDSSILQKKSEFFSALFLGIMTGVIVYIMIRNLH